MDDIVNEAAGCFNIKLNNYSKSKAAFLLGAEGSSMILRKQGDIRKVEELYKTTEYLHSTGFKNTVRYMTADGKPYASLKDGFYTVSTYLGGGKCNFADIDDVSAIVKTIARLHKVCYGTDAPNIAASKTVSHSYYEKRLAEARHIKKWLVKRSSLTDFDVLYIKKYGEYIGRAVETSAQICGYLENVPLILCLNEFKEDNIFIDSNRNVTLLGFENCVLSTPNTDLCQLIRRFIKRGGDAKLISKIISAYNEENSLDSRDMEFIKAYLSFPHKFLSHVNKYYNSKRACSNTQAFARLNTEVAYQDRILEALNII